MTPQQFKAARKACGMTLEAWYDAVAPQKPGKTEIIGKKQMVNHWEAGRRSIPTSVAERARALWQEAAKKALIDSHTA